MRKLGSALILFFLLPWLSTAQEALDKDSVVKIVKAGISDDLVIPATGSIIQARPRVYLELAKLRAFTLVTSPAPLDELDEKPPGKFKVPATDAAEIGRRLEYNSIVVRPDFELHGIVEDPDDNRAIECAVAGNAGWIVSGDRHLLKLGSFSGIHIVSARQYLEMTGIRA